MRRHALLGGLSLLTLSGCSSFDFNFPSLPIGTPAPPAATGEKLGNGPQGAFAVPDTLRLRSFEIQLGKS